MAAIKASIARQHFEHLLDRVRTQGEQYEIQEEGRTVAVLISAADFEILHRQQALQKQTRVEMAALLQERHTRNAHVSVEPATQEIEETTR